MATQFKSNCPHCSTKGAGFEVRFQWHALERPDFAYFLATCGVCRLGVVFHSYAVRADQHPDLTSKTYAYPGGDFEIDGSIPRFQQACPADVPANVQRFYDQGTDNLAAGRWDAAGAMFRKSLDVATKILAPEHSALNLFTRINKMVEAGALTSAIGDWSHEIRLDGNDAVHDDEPETEEDARATQKFTEAFLTYSFTLPAMVEANRAKRAPAIDEPA